MNRTLIITLVLALAGLGVRAADRQGRETASDKAERLQLNQLQRGPVIGDLDGRAQIRVPEGFVFAGPEGTRRILEAMHNPTHGSELGLVAPTNLAWFVVFEFDAVGYVRDDEKTKLDADAILDSIRKGTRSGNEERRNRGWPEIEIAGWEQKPKYNDRTHNLEWAVKATSEDKSIVNHNTRVLGREGVMRVTLVTDPESLPLQIPAFRDVMTGFEFAKGHGYAEYRPGDKVAKYGLTALVVGGATAVALKTGAFKWLWKLIVFGAIAISGFFRNLFGRRKSD